MDALTETLGFLNIFPAWLLVAGILAVALLFGFTGAPLWLWGAAGLLTLWGLGAPWWLLGLFAVFCLLFNLKPLRRTLLSGPLMKLLDALQFLPKISETERTALESGNVWVDGELFSGCPDLNRLMAEDYPELTEEEQAFLDGPVEQVCAMVDDWEVYVNKGFEEEVWDFLREHRFFGLEIPEQYGGHDFSTLAHSAIIAKLSSRCAPLAITVMVPNSLGPAELLVHYGTDEQKDYYLPRLARGEEIPCFALTEPTAGSDAGSMTARGELFRGEDGELYIRLNFTKRYITLAAISTVIGLAFKLEDPENLLDRGEDLGITCALIPSDTEGVKLGRRHDPLGVPFYNCPIDGEDVVVPADAVIGGVEQAGNGWRMLTESLSVGRGISLPAESVAGAKVATRAVGAYTAFRQQFGINIGRFEGIEEPLARIGGFTYLMEAARRYTCGGLDQGAKPAVVTAIAKYHFTEMGRQVVNDAMDILGGAGISRGPRNIFAHAHMAVPIAITVEGANILTRSLIIFGQGAIRCHPYAYQEIDALTRGDVKAFDEAFWKHIGHVVRNGSRAFLLSLTRGTLASTPGGPASGYHRKLAWTSASFAFLADLALGSYGGKLKIKEKISGRFGDILSWMYLATATLRRFEAEGRREEDLPFLRWSLDYAFARIQEAFDNIYREIEVPGLGWLFHGPLALWSRINRIGSEPSDVLGHNVAQAMQRPGEQRDRLTEGIYLTEDTDEALGKYENAFRLKMEAEPLYRKLKTAAKKGELPDRQPRFQIDEAIEKGVLTKQEGEMVRKAELARVDAVQVDEFTLEEYQSRTPAPPSKAEG